MSNILIDVSTLTTIPAKYLQKLSDITADCVCDSVLENKLKNENITEANIGIGKILIKNDSDGISYKFIPNQYFEKTLVETVKTNKSPVSTDIEEALKDKILNTYKDLL